MAGDAADKSVEATNTNSGDYASFADAASQLGDIRVAYSDALRQREAEEEAEDQYYLSHAKEYVELHEQIETSTTQLSSLESFLSTFQNDLSSVSGHISDLQRRSKLLEARLQSRRSLENMLGPLVQQIVLPPEIITLIVDTEPGDAWLPVIPDLEARLTAIRSGPRLETRQNLDLAAEKLRIKSSDKLRAFLISLLAPYRTSVASSLQALQATALLKYRPFFEFLQRLAPRQAHEVQKAYISTAAWYYETGFRRYVRTLERIRVRSVTKDANDAVASTPLAALASAWMTGAPAIPGARAEERDLKMSVEALFRSISLVVQENAASEYAFLAAFFGQNKPAKRVHTAPNGSSAHASDTSWDVLSSAGTELEDDSLSVITASDTTASAHASAEKVKRSLVDHVWRQVFEAAIDYAKNFAHALLDPAPAPVSVLAMIRLNDAIAKSTVCRAASFEQYLVGLRLTLWPLFQKGMDAQAEALRKMVNSSAIMKATARDDAIKTALRQYAGLFTAVVALSEDEDEEMVFSSVLRLRAELQKLLDAKAARITDTKRSSAYLAGHYEDLLKLTRAGPTSHPRSQAEVAHWREKARRAS